MSETVTILSGEFAYLEERSKKLARDKSYLQLVIRLMNKVSAASGLEDTVSCILHNILDVVGGTNIMLYYWVDNTIFSADVYCNKMQLDAIDDIQVQKALTTRKPIEIEHDFSDTQMTTPEFTSAYTWVYPLLVGHDLVGVLKMESLHIGMRELSEHLPTFFNYTALVLKNEILGYTRLKQAYDQLSEMNEELKMEIKERERAEEELVLAKQDWERTFDAVPDLIALIDTNHRILRMNRAMSERLECPPGQVPDCHCYEAIHGLYEPINGCPHARMLISGKEEHSEVVEPRLGGTFDVCTIPLQNNTGQIVGSVHVAHDITARKSAEEELRKSRDELEARVVARTVELQNANEQLQHELTERKQSQEALCRYSEEIHDLYNHAPCGYHSLDRDGVYIRINDTELQWLGYSREEMIGKMKFSDLITESSLQQTFRNTFPQLKKRGWIRDLEFEMVRKDGTILPVLLNATAATDKDGNFLMSRSTIYDITERKKEEERLILAKAASPLTGLPGNVSVQLVINKMLSTGTPFEIAYIDIDNFKPYNDFYGFEKGDLVIKSLAEIIVSVVNRSDAKESSFCGHIGGDDFILITPPYRAEQMASEIIRGFESHLELFHGECDFQAGCYTAVNRKGAEEAFRLLSLSFGILNTLLTQVDSYAQLASIATEVKKSAKRIPGSSIIINKRSQ